MYQRVNGNDYVYTTGIGARELLYLQCKKRENCSVFEQCCRVAGITPVDTDYLTNYKLKRHVLDRDLFFESMEALSMLGKAERFELPQRTVVRVQFAPHVAVKWGAYRVDDAIYFAPRTVAPPSVSDIRIKPVRSKRPSQTTVELPTMLLDADMSGINQEGLQ